MSKVLIAASAAAVAALATPAATQVPPPVVVPAPVIVPPMAPGGPITMMCPRPNETARAVGRVLGVRIPGGATPSGPPTPAFSGTSRVALTGGVATVANQWRSAGKTTFSHVIEGPVGPVRLTLETCSTATGGETVAIYPATAEGYRMPRRPRVMFSIAVPRGNVRQATLVIPPSRRGSPTGSVHLAVVVENASGRFHQGAYRLTIAR